ncbi:hypothetical protein [Paraburkholderia saeva]|uniref:Uncharacterized protein n=1 Tax=Paraburkholderia saeva TaxID=2777537 RepID=A0A9N8RSS3_9BURK|nr:hypothetical protein [Paraburkholderia saeva]CAG4886908.1 hypothetical protein LMG31841_00289 [Paraburkholderia saeva]CAG4887077.1 hypothetical protein R70241_00328 [Paraburkholderia saeva]
MQLSQLIDITRVIGSVPREAATSYDGHQKLVLPADYFKVRAAASSAWYLGSLATSLIIFMFLFIASVAMLHTANWLIEVKAGSAASLRLFGGFAYAMLAIDITFFIIFTISSTKRRILADQLSDQRLADLTESDREARAKHHSSSKAART